MRTLICGSIAYDNIMVFKGRFADHILPDQVHILNVAFLVPELRREFGGCAGNIGYNLHLLGGQPVIMASVGADAAPYLARLDGLTLERTCVRQFGELLTAQAFITTDLDDNQITAFHPGAMMQSHQNHVADASDIGLGIVAPDGREGMMAHALEFAQAGIPYVFDPGQGLPMFNGEELRAMIDAAAYVAVNDYEAKLLAERIGRPAESVAQADRVLIITRGAQGSVIHANGKAHEVPAVKASSVLDPTGCGDAYRGGLLYGIAQGMDWPTIGRLASTMGAIKVAHQGPQNHAPTRQDIADTFKSSFGYWPW